MSPGSVVGLLVVVLPLGFALVFLPCGSFVSVLLVGLGGCCGCVSLAFCAWFFWFLVRLGSALLWHMAGFDLVSPRFPHGLGYAGFSFLFCFWFFISVKWIWQCISSRGFSFLVFVLFQWCQLRTCQHSFMSDETHLQQKPSARVIRNFWGSRPIFWREISHPDLEHSCFFAVWNRCLPRLKLLIWWHSLSCWWHTWRHMALLRHFRLIKIIARRAVMVRFQTSSSCALQNLIFKRGVTRIHQSSQLIRVFGAKQRFLQSAVRLCHFSFWQQLLNKLRLSGNVPYPFCGRRGFWNMVGH